MHADDAPSGSVLEVRTYQKKHIPALSICLWLYSTYYVGLLSTASGLRLGSLLSWRLHRLA